MSKDKQPLSVESALWDIILQMDLETPQETPEQRAARVALGPQLFQVDESFSYGNGTVKIVSAESHCSGRLWGYVWTYRIEWTGKIGGKPETRKTWVTSDQLQRNADNTITFNEALRPRNSYDRLSPCIDC